MVCHTVVWGVRQSRYHSHGPDLEKMGIRILRNECETIWQGGESIYLAGNDDTHYYRVDNIEKGMRGHADLQSRSQSFPGSGRCCNSGTSQSRCLSASPGPRPFVVG
jgi:hypothetical protein